MFRHAGISESLFTPMMIWGMDPSGDEKGEGVGIGTIDLPGCRVVLAGIWDAGWFFSMAQKLRLVLWRCMRARARERQDTS